MKKYIKPESIILNLATSSHFADTKNLGSYLGESTVVTSVVIGASQIKQGWSTSQGSGNTMSKDGLVYDETWGVWEDEDEE